MCCKWYSRFTENPHVVLVCRRVCKWWESSREPLYLYAWMPHIQSKKYQKHQHTRTHTHLHRYATTDTEKLFMSYFKRDVLNFYPTLRQRSLHERTSYMELNAMRCDALHGMLSFHSFVYGFIHTASSAQQPRLWATIPILRGCPGIA